MRHYLKKIKKWLKNNWPVWVLLLISAVVYHKWLSFGIFTHADYWFYFSETSRDFLRYSAWDSQAGLGAPNLFLWMIGYKLLPGFWGFFGFDSNISDKFLIFWPFAFLTPLFTYLFAKQFLKNNFGAFVAACVFSFNTYYLAINTQGHFSLTLAGTFAPLAMFFFWRYFDPPSLQDYSELRRASGKKKNLIASALVLLLVGGYDFRVFYILFFIILALPFWLLLTQTEFEQKKIFFRRHFSAMTLFFSLIFIFNLFWLLPTAMTGSLADNNIVARPLVDNNFSLDLNKTLTLFHPFWNGSEPKWFDDQKIPLYFWLIPIMALLGAFWNRKNRKIVFWFLIALAGVFLSKQDALPLKSAYVWLHQNFPGFNAFREASKFYFIVALSYAILIGAFAEYFFEHLGQKRILKYSVFVLASLLFLWNVKPILTGEMNSIFTPQKIADDEIKIRDYTLSQNGSFRTLWVPSDSKWASYSAFRPKINAIETRRSDWKEIKDYAELQGGEPGGIEKNQLFFSENFTARLLSQSAVRYLLVNNQNYFTIENMVANPAWKKIDLNLENLQFFENQSVRPRIYLTENMETIHRNNPFQAVDYTYKNSSRWDFTLKDLIKPVWINFSEKYHPDWQLVCGNFHWYDSFLKKSAFLSQKNHLKTDAGLNSFLIDPAEIKEKCAPKNNKRIALSLFYRPQAYLYLGEIISLAAIFISLATLVFWKEKEHNSKIAQKKMRNNFYLKIMDFAKTEKRIFFALTFLILTFLVNQALYADKKITAQNCLNGKCATTAPKKPQLSKENSFYYIDDLFKNQPSGYYRLTFQEKSSAAEKIILKLNTYSEKESPIGELTFDSFDNFQNQEMIFFLPEGFENLLFQKENSGDDANVFIKEAGISKLNIESEKELAAMKKTIIGKTKTTVVGEKQLDTSYGFPWLKESKTIIGQVFRASDEYISAISFNIDINKNLDPGSRQYVLSLRKVEYSKENISVDGPVIASLAFSAASIEKYRQNDGTFLFPLYGILEKNAHYLLSVDNSKVSVDKQNYLEFKGSRDDSSYADGSAVIKKNKVLYAIDGDLYFKIYGADFSEENGAKILNGAKIEDLGKGAGKYSYATKGEFADLLDLKTSSSGTGFSENSKVIIAEAKNDASFSYAINTLYPIKKMNFSASQLKPGWKKVKASYSFDQENWIDMPFSEETEKAIASIDNSEDSNDNQSDVADDNSSADDSADTSPNADTVAEKNAEKTIQFFNFNIIPSKETATIYFKITYDPNDESKARFFALKNLRLTADLKMK